MNIIILPLSILHWLTAASGSLPNFVLEPLQFTHCLSLLLPLGCIFMPWYMLTSMLTHLFSSFSYFCRFPQNPELASIMTFITMDCSHLFISVLSPARKLLRVEISVLFLYLLLHHWEFFKIYDEQSWVGYMRPENSLARKIRWFSFNEYKM